jgi:hypothetical protein
MANMATYDQVGKAEDVSDIITNISPTKTPFSSMLKDEKIHNIVHQWQQDALSSVVSAPQVEGANAVTATQVPTTMLNNNTQIYMDTAAVTGTAEVVKLYGRDKELAYQLAKKAAQLKRNLEYSMVGTGQAAVLGNDSTARQMAGYQTLCDASTVQTLGTAGPLTETILLTSLQLLYANGAEPDTILIKPTDGTKVAAFTNNNGRVKYIDNSDKKIVNVVDVYVSPYGEQKIVLDRFSAVGNAFIYEQSMWKKLVLRSWFRETLAKVGDSTQVQLVGEFSLKHLNSFASALVANLT